MTKLLDLARKMLEREQEESKVNKLNSILFEIIKYQNVLIAGLRKYGSKENNLSKILDLLHQFSDLKNVPHNDFIKDKITQSFGDLIESNDLESNEIEVLGILEQKYKDFLSVSEEIL